MEMSAAEHAEQSDHRVNDGEFHNRDERLARFFVVEDFPSAHGNRNETARRKSGKKRVRVLAEDVRIGDEREEVIHHGAPVLDRVTDRVLHERVRNENPKRG